MYLKQRVDTQCGAGLARIFSASVLKELANKGYSSLAGTILKETGLLPSIDPSMSLRVFFEELLQLLFRSYRSEYIYKNAIANKILLGKHSINTSFMLTEFRVADCKADTVILNGTSSVYEIKSQYDNLDRLKKQLSAYRRFFDNVHVITSSEQLQKVKDEIDEDVGLMVLNDRNTIKTERHARSLKKSVEPNIIFDSLRKYEYIEIIKAAYGHVPDVPNTRIFRECKNLFCELDPETAHNYMVKSLLQRGECSTLREFILDVPYSLKAASLSCRFNLREKSAFLDVLNTDVQKSLLSVCM